MGQVQPTAARDQQLAPKGRHAFVDGDAAALRAQLLGGDQPRGPTADDGDAQALFVTHVFSTRLLALSAQPSCTPPPRGINALTGGAAQGSSDSTVTDLGGRCSGMRPSSAWTDTG